MIDNVFVDPVYFSIKPKIDQTIREQAYIDFYNLLKNLEELENICEMNRMLIFQITSTYIEVLWKHPPFSDYCNLNRWREWFWRKVYPRFKIENYDQQNLILNFQYYNPLVPKEVVKEWNRMLSHFLQSGIQKLNIIIPERSNTDLIPSQTQDNHQELLEVEISQWTRIINPARLYCELLNLEGINNRPLIIQRVLRLIYELNMIWGVWEREPTENSVLTIEMPFLRTLMKMERPSFGLGCELPLFLARLLESISMTLYIPKQEINRLNNPFRVHKRRGTQDLFQRDVFKHSDGAGRSIRIYYKSRRNEENNREIVLKELIPDEHPS